MHDPYPARTLKADAARRQLGTALHLWLDDLDPVSVHVLASGGCEIANALAKKGGKPFSAFSLEVHSELTEADLPKLRNVFWNAMKRSHHKNGEERNDEELLATPLESENEARLAEGWFDLMQVMPLPIEAQVLVQWFLAKYLNPVEIEPVIDELFPALRSMSAAEQKNALRKTIAQVREMNELMQDRQTDRRPLVLPA